MSTGTYENQKFDFSTHRPKAMASSLKATKVIKKAACIVGEVGDVSGNSRGIVGRK